MSDSDKIIDFDIERKKELISKIRECDSLHNNCDYLLEHNECDDIVEYFEQLQKEKIIYEANNKIEELLYLASKCSTIYKNNIEIVGIYDRLKELLEILDGGKNVNNK